MTSDVRLIVNGRKYGGWKSIRITRSMESMAGSFDLTVSDRWAEDQEPWPIKEEDACRVEIDGEVVIDGWVERRGANVDANTAGITTSGYDKSQALVACSALLDKWTFRNLSTLEFIRKVAGQYGISVSVQEGLSLPSPPRKYVIQPGDTAYQAIVRATTMAGVLAVSDSNGGIVLTQTGSARAAALLQGVNVETMRSTRDASQRFYRYVVLTQRAGDDETSGNSTRVRAEAIDHGVRRTDRTHVIRPSRGMSQTQAQQLADWEARTRAGRSESGEVGVVGWRQTTDGPLWAPNETTEVVMPFIDLAGDMVITEVTLSIDDQGGEVATLRLMRPDAFAPSPLATSGLSR